jgi:hypothetical protein
MLPRTGRDPGRRGRLQEKRKAYDAILNRAELREANGLTQAELAERLGVSQPNVSKLEAVAASPHARAIYHSTLGGYIAALGGHLEVRAILTGDLAVPRFRSALCYRRVATPGVRYSELQKQPSWKSSG